MAKENGVGLRCGERVISDTLAMFRAAGATGKECVALLLSDRRADRRLIVEAYRPEHIAELDRFWIPAASMDALMDHLRENRLSLVAQVHSHPREAFHSWADDKYAIVRHVGALSIVVPDFAVGVTPQNFTSKGAFFLLDIENRWGEITKAHVDRYFRIV